MKRWSCGCTGALGVSVKKADPEVKERGLGIVVYKRVHNEPLGGVTSQVTESFLFKKESPLDPHLTVGGEYWVLTQV